MVFAALANLTFFSKIVIGDSLKKKLNRNLIIRYFEGTTERPIIPFKLITQAFPKYWPFIVEYILLN